MSDGEVREEYSSSSSPGSAITSNHSPMEHSFDLFPSTECAFGDGFPPDPLCKLNLKETSDFVRAFPVSSKSSRGAVGGSTERRRSSAAAAAAAAPSTPGRPIFNFSSGNLPPRKSIPSKWDDAEKWLISTTGHFRDSPAHSRLSRQQSSVFKPKLDPYVVDHQKPRFIEEEELHRTSSEVFLKDKFTDNVEPALQDFRHSEPTKEGFLFRSPPSHEAPTKERRDVGTEMTPLGSSTTSRCHTPAKSSSPARHNTPADRSGPLACSNIGGGGGISGLKECHFAKLDLGAQFDSAVSNWSSREEEEEEVSKSLRHFEASKGRRSIGDDRGATTTWEDGERTKSCIRYQREEARIQAWVNLQKAKAEARSRKLEVKIQKMRSDLEEKQMKRMAIVHRRAEEWRASAQLQHSQQVLRASEQAQRMKVLQRSHFIDYTSCGCFPCNNHLL